jgi:hypothetical protein
MKRVPMRPSGNPSSRLLITLDAVEYTIFPPAGGRATVSGISFDLPHTVTRLAYGSHLEVALISMVDNANRDDICNRGLQSAVLIPRMMCRTFHPISPLQVLDVRWRAISLLNRRCFSSCKRSLSNAGTQKAILSIFM